MFFFITEGLEGVVVAEGLEGVTVAEEEGGADVEAVGVAVAVEGT